MADASFITAVPQQPERSSARAYKDEINELEALVSGVTQTSQSTLLLKKKREMREVSDNLAYMKQQYLERMKACDEKHTDFERKQLEMKDSVIKFEKFIQENDAKRQRAEMRHKEEQRKVTQKEEELKNLKEELSATEKEREKLQNELSRLNRYKEYLDNTVEHSEEGVEDIEDILNRLTTLENANSDLMLLEGQNEIEMDAIRKERQIFIVETQNRILVQNSKVHQCQNQLEKLKATSKMGRDEEEAKQDRVKDVNRENGQIIMAIRNLYGRCCSATRTKMPPFSDRWVGNAVQLDKCLTFIEERIVDLMEIKEGHDEQLDKLPPIPGAGGKKNR
ncbi:hypothetical protein TrRE_jg11561 [Triparma retinervis]|uniref:DUF4200 domain-containing protein n=1 Tax=Triparma retinervis TaxID=2557542 RepID=A0A9W7AA17_9STRA|nr:hypothetical protein TrRE_jg11561 [Triparma retinervis]